MWYLLVFSNESATTEIYTLSLHDALPIYVDARCGGQAYSCLASTRLRAWFRHRHRARLRDLGPDRLFRPLRLHCHRYGVRSEEHTSELQSRRDLVCRLLLEKKKKQILHGH